MFNTFYPFVREFCFNFWTFSKLRCSQQISIPYLKHSHQYLHSLGSCRFSHSANMQNWKPGNFTRLSSFFQLGQGILFLLCPVLYCLQDGCHFYKKTIVVGPGRPDKMNYVKHILDFAFSLSLKFSTFTALWPMEWSEVKCLLYSIQIGWVKQGWVDSFGKQRKEKSSLDQRVVQTGSLQKVNTQGHCKHSDLWGDELIQNMQTYHGRPEALWEQQSCWQGW